MDHCKDTNINNLDVPTAIDLFAGAGGLSEALKTSGFKVMGAIEYEEIFASSYKENHGDHILVEDICKVDCESFSNKFNIIPRELDLLAGCSPCQGFSKQFKYKNKELNEDLKVKEDSRNFLVFEYVRFVHYFQPKYIFFENVPGIVSHLEIFNSFIKKLTRKTKNFPGYDIDYHVVNAADYGVPQRRKRFVLIGKRRDLKQGNKIIKIFPEPTHYDPQRIKESDKKPWVTIKETISHLPKLEAGQTDEKDILHFSKGISEQNMVRMFYTPHNGGSRKDWPELFIAWPPETGIAPLSLWLTCHKSGEKKVGYGDVYGRMRYDSVSATLTGGCLSITKGRFAHPEQNRGISAREAALIQTFPENYIFKGSKEKIALQIGNAVPVKLGKVFMDSILRDLSKFK